jgi:enoyl-CoA hydratase
MKQVQGKLPINLYKFYCCRCVVITGEGKAFSAGGDLQFIIDRANDHSNNNSLIMKKFYERFLSVRQLHVPVISAINGPAIGAGLCLALACDLRIAAKNAKLGVTFTSLGFHPGMGASHFLPMLVGNQVSTRMLLMGETITGEEAKNQGLVLDAVENDKVLSTALDIARKISDQSSVAVQTTIRTIRNQQDQNLQTNLWREASAQAICYSSPDVLEGVAAIKEKRNPVFRN